MRQAHPRGLRELLRIPGIGPKRASRLFHEAGVTTPRRLVGAARAGRLSAMKGFGSRMEADLLQAASAYLASGHRWKLSFAAQQAEAISRYLHESKDIASLDVAGSYRRQQDTVGDLDILVSAEQSTAVRRRFPAYPDVARVLLQGPTRSSIVLESGLQIDLRVIKPDAFGAALVYFTGSKAHNMALRRIAQKEGLKINEYGVYRGACRIAGNTEQSVYAALGLPSIPQSCARTAARSNLPGNTGFLR